MTNPHPKNVPGAFYVEDGCCVACGVPEYAAPDAFEWDGNHCFVSRQPCSAASVDRLVVAMWSSEVSCIRYQGEEPALLRRIAEAGCADQCDRPTLPVRHVLRDRAHFRSARESDTAEAMTARFRDHLRSQRQWLWVAAPRSWARETVHFAPKLGRFSRLRPSKVTFFASGSPLLFEVRVGGRWISRQGNALLLHEWLMEEDGAAEVVWTSPEERHEGRSGFHMPI